MARTKILVPPEKQCGYTSVIVSYSTGIDSVSENGGDRPLDKNAPGHTG